MRIVGHVDRCDPEKLVGWIYCRDLPGERVVLQVFAGKTQIGACTAGLPRQDLMGRQMGDGQCGFHFKMPPGLTPQALRSIRLRIKDSNVFLLPDPTDEAPEAPPSPAPAGEAAGGPVPLSRFGSLWIDRSDWIDRLGEKCRLGEISDALAMQICRFVRDGYVILKHAVDPILVDELADELDRYWTAPPRGFIVETFEPDGNRRVAPADIRYRDGRTKQLDLYALSATARRAIASPAPMEFLNAIFEAPPKAFQGLTFWNGSQQAIHKDTAYVKVDGNKVALAATWLALENIQEGSGELEYYIGSHRAPDFLFGGVDKWAMVAQTDHPRFLQSLHDDAAKYRQVKGKFLAEKGDVLVWHADLAHGGSPVTKPGVTRKSLVTHYCPVTEEPFYRRTTHFATLTENGCTFVSEHMNVA